MKWLTLISLCLAQTGCSSEPDEREMETDEARRKRIEAAEKHADKQDEETLKRRATESFEKMIAHAKRLASEETGVILLVPQERLRADEPGFDGLGSGASTFQYLFRTKYEVANTSFSFEATGKQFKPFKATLEVNTIKKTAPKQLDRTLAMLAKFGEPESAKPFRFTFECDNSPLPGREPAWILLSSMCFEPESRSWRKLKPSAKSDAEYEFSGCFRIAAGRSGGDADH